MKPIIRIDGISKKYRIGTRRAPHAGTLKEALSEALSSFARSTSGKNSDSSHGEWVWVLKDLNFEVRPGEVLGIIGRNGAGKSTLLKILSRVTEPTSGQVELYGRLGSLLEIGTGFHPELSGRENIYLNGAILGMSRREINRKFDEIVAFAEIDKFLDTAVKHYSSGMYMRLAFAVAVHLEPEVLLVDEVLAVGDAAFQKKCLERMAKVASEGRTILFVSHQLSAITQLCSRVLLLNEGRIVEEGGPEQVVDRYLRDVSPSQDGFSAPTQNKDIFIAEVYTLDREGRPKSCFTHEEEIVIVIKCNINRWVPNTVMGFNVTDHRGRKIFTTINSEWSHLQPRIGEVETTAKIPGHFLVPGKYVFTFAVNQVGVRLVEWVENVIPILIVDAGSEFAVYEGADYGCVFANCEWSFDSAPSHANEYALNL